MREKRTGQIKPELLESINYANLIKLKIRAKASLLPTYAKFTFSLYPYFIYDNSIDFIKN